MFFFFFNNRLNDVECSSRYTQNNRTSCIVDLIKFRRNYTGCNHKVCTGMLSHDLHMELQGYLQDSQQSSYVKLNRVYEGNCWNCLHHFVLPMEVGSKYILHLLQNIPSGVFFSHELKTALLSNEWNTLFFVVSVVACFFKFCIWIFYESLFVNFKSNVWRLLLKHIRNYFKLACRIWQFF